MQGFRCPLCLGDDSGAGGVTGQKPGSNVGWFLEPKGSCKASQAHHPSSVWNLFQKPTLWWLSWDLFLAGWPEISGGWICYQGVLGSLGPSMLLVLESAKKKKGEGGKVFGKIPLLTHVGTNINLVVYTPELFIVQLSTLLYYLITALINKLWFTVRMTLFITMWIWWPTICLCLHCPHMLWLNVCLHALSWEVASCQAGSRLQRLTNISKITDDKRH